MSYEHRQQIDGVEVVVVERVGDRRHGYEWNPLSGKLEYREFCGFHASVVGHPEIWEAGSTPQSALGGLIKTHPGTFVPVSERWKHQ